MDMVAEGFKEALRLIVGLDTEVFEVVLLSLQVSLCSLLVAAALSIPLGIYVARHDFFGKRLLMRCIHTLMGMPPVLCGLFVYILFMRRGPLGGLKLNYTVTVMVIAQVLLMIPILMGLTVSAARERGEQITMLAKTLGAGRWHTMGLFLSELRVGILTAVISGFSRGISEVGAVMIVGGNIEGKTRVMTTYISQLKGMGDFERAIAVGLILLALSFLINTVLYHFQEGKGFRKQRKGQNPQSQEQGF